MGVHEERTVEAYGRAHLGLVTRHQALSLGMHWDQISRRIRCRSWEVLHPGVFALPGSPVTWERRVMAAVLAAGPSAVASHMTALMLDEIDGAYRTNVEITIPDTTPLALRGVVVHRSLALAETDRSVVRGIAVTSVARTLADCSGILSLGQLARALDDALVRDLVTRAEVEEVANRLRPARGRRIARLRMLVSERGKEADTADSRPEMRMFRVLRAAGLPEAVSQHPVRIGDHGFFLDVSYPDLMIDLEYQGFDPHRSRSAFDADARRARLLTAAGWKVLFFTSKDSDTDIVESIRLFVTSGASRALQVTNDGLRRC
jgi:very-short-patch-repair endonuclease